MRTAIALGVTLIVTMAIRTARPISEGYALSRGLTRFDGSTEALPFIIEVEPDTSIDICATAGIDTRGKALSEVSLLT